MIMKADAIIIGIPVFQTSIPARLKDFFDLLPVNAFHDKVVSIVVTVGSEKHYLVEDTFLFVQVYKQITEKENEM